jgi:hypothetical protein
MSEMTTLQHPPLALDEKALHERFTHLTAQWREETQFLSSSTAIAMHPAYQQIIGMGPAALPLILRELEREPSHWFWALKCITGADPVPPDQKGQRKAMRDAWLQWAREQGYQW